MPFGTDLIKQIHNTPIIPNSLAIWGLGQMGIAIKGPDATLVIDPCLTDIVRELFGENWVRAYPEPIQSELMSGINYYLVSHEHLDHLEPRTAASMLQASPDMRFVAPGWCAEELAKIQVTGDRLLIPQALEQITLPGTSIRLTAIPSAHYAKEYDEQKGYRWFGYLIEWNGVVFYHAGDTIIHPGYVETLKQLPTADVAMVPVNGRDWYRETVTGAVGNLLPDEAARLAQEMGWSVLIPGHNDMYPKNAIPMGSIVEALEKFAPRQPYKFLQPGELYYFVK